MGFMRAQGFDEELNHDQGFYEAVDGVSSVL